MKKIFLLSMIFAIIGCQTTKSVTATTNQPTANPTTGREPSSLSALERISCWNNARGMDKTQATYLCGSDNPDAVYSCWSDAKRLDNQSALVLCRHASAEKRASAIDCWRNARRVNAESASVLCLSENPEKAIDCWKNASRVDGASAALLCLSENTETAISCWRGARGVDADSAAQLCYTGSKNSPAYLAWKYIQQVRRESNAYSAGVSSVTCQTCSSQ